MTLNKNHQHNSRLTISMETDVKKDFTKMRKNKYSPANIANYILMRSFDEKIPLNPMKLIKLVYIAYGWNLAFTNQKLFDETIEAWKYGPVVPSLYHEFKRFGKGNIDELSCEMDEKTGELSVVPLGVEIGSDASKILHVVWENYKNWSATELSDLTHKEGSPWQKAIAKNGPNSALNDEDIRAISEYAIRNKMKTFDKN